MCSAHFHELTPLTCHAKVRCVEDPTYSSLKNQNAEMTLWHDCNRLCSSFQKCKCHACYAGEWHPTQHGEAITRMATEFAKSSCQLLLLLPQQPCTAPTCKLVDSYCHYTWPDFLCRMGTLYGWRKEGLCSPRWLDAYATVRSQNDKIVFLFHFAKLLLLWVLFFWFGIIFLFSTTNLFAA